jgi:hypothetical protein
MYSNSNQFLGKGPEYRGGQHKMPEQKIPWLIYGRLKRTENFDEHFLLH